MKWSSLSDMNCFLCSHQANTVCQTLDREMSASVVSLHFTEVLGVAVTADAHMTGISNSLVPSVMTWCHEGEKFCSKIGHSLCTALFCMTQLRWRRSVNITTAAHYCTVQHNASRFSTDGSWETTASCAYLLHRVNAKKKRTETADKKEFVSVCCIAARRTNLINSQICFCLTTVALTS